MTAQPKSLRGGEERNGGDAVSTNMKNMHSDFELEEAQLMTPPVCLISCVWTGQLMQRD